MCSAISILKEVKWLSGKKNTAFLFNKQRLKYNIDAIIDIL